MKKGSKKPAARKVPFDGPIPPKDRSNVLENTNPQAMPLPDFQVVPPPSAPLRPVCDLPAASPPPPLVP
jgi:hypothetical protein